MSLVGLFAGIGGFEKAFAMAGEDARMLVDLDGAAQAVLRARFPNAEIQGDVRSLSGLPSDATIVTAGFPCQNLSMAGDKSGIHGTKSGVIEYMLDLLAGHAIETVVIENVYFMLQLDGGRAMGWLVGRFEELGFQWAYRVVDTRSFGLPQRRKRVYFVASRAVDPRAVLFADESPPPPTLTPVVGTTPIGFYWTEGRSGIGTAVDGIPPLKVGSSIGIPSAPAVLFQDGEVLMPSLSAAEGLQGFPAGWTDIGELDRCRWRLVGNAVSVPVAHWVACRILAPGTPLEFDERPLPAGHKWPPAARGKDGARFAVEASVHPVTIEAPSISSFRDEAWSRLSDRALDGFTKRAEEGNLRLPDGFIEAVRQAPRRA